MKEYMDKVMKHQTIITETSWEIYKQLNIDENK